VEFIPAEGLGGECFNRGGNRLACLGKEREPDKSEKGKVNHSLYAGEKMKRHHDGGVTLLK